MEAPVWKMPPEAIEKKSFAIIDSEAGSHNWSSEAWSIVRRLVHTSADFDYVKDTVISEGAIEAAILAIRQGSTIVTDTKMALNGINKGNLKSFGNQVFCLIDDERIVEKAREVGSTRAQAAVDLVSELYMKPKNDGGIWVVGNAPTALFRIMEKHQTDADFICPRLVVGLPVGFVNAYESKEALTKSNIPYYITNLSRKGGSNVGASVINALAKLALA